jgi:hypothetical protein
VAEEAAEETVFDLGDELPCSWLSMTTACLRVSPNDLCCCKEPGGWALALEDDGRRRRPAEGELVEEEAGEAEPASSIGEPGAIMLVTARRWWCCTPPGPSLGELVAEGAAEETTDGRRDAVGFSLPCADALLVILLGPPIEAVADGGVVAATAVDGEASKSGDPRPNEPRLEKEGVLASDEAAVRLLLLVACKNCTLSSPRARIALTDGVTLAVAAAAARLDAGPRAAATAVAVAWLAPDKNDPCTAALWLRRWLWRRGTSMERRDDC